jgi:hypothetical protein
MMSANQQKLFDVVERGSQTDDRYILSMGFDQ